MSRIEITDETGIIQVAGDAAFPDGIDTTGVSSPDTVGPSDSITIETGDSSADASGAILIETGAAATGSGNIVLRVGSAGVTQGHGELTASGGDPVISWADDVLAFFDGSRVAKQTVTGALSAVVDPAAAAVLTSLIAALAAATGYNLVTDGTT